MRQLGSPREFYAGAIYIAFGILGLWFGWAYPMGTAGRMGGGYFPKVLSVVLIMLGLVALYRGVRVTGPAMAVLRIKPLVLILSACSLFGILLEPIGLIGSLFILIIMAAMASDQFRSSPMAIVGALGLVASCALVFVWGLSVPLPLLGSLLKPA